MTATDRYEMSFPLSQSQADSLANLNFYSTALGAMLSSVSRNIEGFKFDFRTLSAAMTPVKDPSSDHAFDFIVSMDGEKVEGEVKNEETFVFLMDDGEAASSLSVSICAPSDAVDASYTVVHEGMMHLAKQAWDRKESIDWSTLQVNARKYDKPGKYEGMPCFDMQAEVAGE